VFGFEVQTENPVGAQDPEPVALNLDAVMVNAMDM
jgi:hypothetical protein